MPSSPTAPDTPSARGPGGGFTRRTFVIGAGATLAGATVLGLVGCGDAAPPAPTGNEVLDFITVSSILTGVRPLPRTPARDYLVALEQAGLECSPMHFTQVAFGDGGAPMGMIDLERQGATKLPGADQCMRAIAATWWSGIVHTVGGDAQVISFADALVWQRVHESSQCLGTVGSWSRPGEQGT